MFYSIKEILFKYFEQLKKSYLNWLKGKIVHYFTSLKLFYITKELRGIVIVE